MVFIPVAAIPHPWSLLMAVATPTYCMVTAGCVGLKNSHSGNKYAKDDLSYAAYIQHHTCSNWQDVPTYYKIIACFGQRPSSGVPSMHTGSTYGNGGVKEFCYRHNTHCCVLIYTPEEGYHFWPLQTVSLTHYCVVYIPVTDQFSIFRQTNRQTDKHTTQGGGRLTQQLNTSGNHDLASKRGCCR